MPCFVVHEHHATHIHWAFRLGEFRRWAVGSGLKVGCGVWLERMKYAGKRSPEKLENEVHDKSNCPFCNLDNARVILANDYAMAIYDGFPVSRGHSLIVPKRHIISFFEATTEEQIAMLELLTEIRQLLLKEISPDAFNIGINDGPAAGQTINHLHIHLIPRFAGDTEDPRGGVRWIFPDKAVYWTEEEKP